MMSIDLLSKRVKTDFWNRVRKTRGCWEWIGNRDRDGYGLLATKTPDGKCGSVGAHRIAWELTNGEIPHKLMVLHRCDNPSCVRPDHLFVGTAADNSADMVEKGRAARGDRHGLRLHPQSAPAGDRNGSRTKPECLKRGEQNPASKLTVEQVREIKRTYKKGKHGFAKKYGVSKESILAIIGGKTWVHVEP